MAATERSKQGKKIVDIDEIVENIRQDSECVKGALAERQPESAHTTEPPESFIALEKQEKDGAMTCDLEKQDVDIELTTASDHLDNRQDSTEIEGSKTEEAQSPTTSVSSRHSETARVFHISSTVRLGGVILTLCAGMVNAISFMALSAFVSHMTGTATKIGLGLEEDDRFDPNEDAMMVVSFVGGAALTGFLIAKDTIHFGMALYDLCLLSESGLLIATALCYEQSFAKFLAAAACGLQNGMATHWGGAVIRTTHVTGLLTDVGLVLGRLTSLFCRKRCGASFDSFDRAFIEDDLSKLSVLLLIFVGFVTGVFAGAHLYNMFEHMAFFVPAAITGGLGISYAAYRVFVLGHHFFSDAEMEAIDINERVEADLMDQTPHGEEENSPTIPSSQNMECPTSPGGCPISPSGMSQTTAHSHNTTSSRTKGAVICITRKKARARTEPTAGRDLVVKARASI